MWHSLSGTHSLPVLTHPLCSAAKGQGNKSLSTKCQSTDQLVGPERTHNQRRELSAGHLLLLTLHAGTMSPNPTSKSTTLLHNCSPDWIHLPQMWTLSLRIVAPPHHRGSSRATGGTSRSTTGGERNQPGTIWFTQQHLNTQSHSLTEDQTPPIQQSNESSPLGWHRNWRPTDCSRPTTGSQPERSQLSIVLWRRSRVGPISNHFDFVTGGWLARQIKRSSAGTAVDQWGWDSREMWVPHG